MALLLLLALPIVEIYVLVQVGSRIGVMNTFFALLAIGVLGGGLAKATGRYIFQNLQMSIARGEVPATQVIQGMMVFLGGVLFVIPGFVTDIIALALILPGTRHLIAAYIRKQMKKKMSSGQFRVFTGGPFGGGVFGGTSAKWGHRPSPTHETDDTRARDVTPKVIDVTPISSTSTRPESGSDDNGPDRA